MTVRLRECAPVVVPEELWRLREQRHHEQVDLLTADHLERRRRGESHPVVDFLFTYYRTSVATLRRWHPGPGVLLENAHQGERSEWRHYRRDSVADRDGLVVDARSVWTRCGSRAARARDVVAATAGRRGATGCFGLHEWAMLYRAGRDDVRHGRVPLRLPRERVDDVVRGSRLQCTHFDAFRFFTDAAAPRNRDQLTRDHQLRTEQPACLHAGMDVYAHTAALEAGAPGELLLDTLRAAFAAREVDMRSSPYDLSAWGLDPIPVETGEGRGEFVAFQKLWVERTQALRSRFLAAVDLVEGLSTPVGDRGTTHGRPAHVTPASR